MDYVDTKDPHAVRLIAEHWLAAWVGRDPDALLAHYASDARYEDPANPDGIYGHALLRPYFDHLLRWRAGWVWSRTELVPVLHGFVCYWNASVATVSGKAIRVTGTCRARLREHLITWHEVFLDKSRPFAPPSVSHRATAIDASIR